MTRNEAVVRTSKGIWNNISKYITERIEDTCDCGENETRVYKDKLSEEDINRLIGLGYNIELDTSDSYLHEYIISWK
jgi:hypothetical protein